MAKGKPSPEVCSPEKKKEKLKTSVSSFPADLHLAIAAANENDIKLPSGSLTTAVYDKLKNDPELGEKDFSVVFKWLEEGNRKEKA
jgi:3-hydroxyisobutyrate dehydrogenase-like beta-hydroxyacid dehydrogenase